MPCRTYYTGRMRFIHHYQRVIFFRQFTNLIQWSHITIHREYTICSNNAVTLCLRFLQTTFQVSHISISVTIAFCLTQTYTIYNRCMIQRIWNNSVFFCKQRFEQTTVSIKTSCIKYSIFCFKIIRNGSFQLFVQILSPTDKAYGRHTEAMCIHCLFGSIDQTLVIWQT